MVTADLPYVGLRSFVNKSHFALKKADGAVDQTDEETLSPTTGCGASIANTQGRERKRRSDPGGFETRRETAKVDFCPRQESNLRPSRYECAALPAELHGRWSKPSTGFHKRKVCSACTAHRRLRFFMVFHRQKNAPPFSRRGIFIALKLWGD